MTVSAFWDMTPRETRMVVGADRQTRRYEAQYEQDRDLRLAWYAAALARRKRMPSLKALLDEGKPAQTLSEEEMAERKREHHELRDRMMPDAR